MHEADVLIAGGGPAGLSAGRAAAGQGARTVLFEANKEIGSPIRTSGGTFIGSMRQLGIPDRCWHPVSRLRLVAPESEAVFDYPEPELCILDVRATYQFLAECAIAAGASIRSGFSVRGLIMQDDRVGGVRVQDPMNRLSDWRASVTIDATGHRSVLLREAGVYAGAKRFGVGAEYDLYAPGYDQSEALLLVGSQVAPCGYAWIFPYGRGRVRAGVGIQHGGEASIDSHPLPYLDALIKNAKYYRANLRGAQPVEYHHGLIPAEGPMPAYVTHGLLGVGDAAGQPSALVGEGIRWGASERTE